MALGLAFSGTAYAQQDGTSGGTTNEPAASSSEAGAAASSATGSSSSTPDGQPSNQVGEKFELPRYSEENQTELISGLCAIQLKNMSREACSCLADASLEALSDPQRDYLIASVVAPPVADRMLSDGRVGDPDQAKIFGFLQTYSESCRTAAAGSSGSAPSPEPQTDNLPETPGVPAQSDGASSNSSNPSN
ncbi:hypothetical protein DYI37_01365 [Fulvimarina endophytica]|uniref:Uncharacterized protein n=2 Tax=Fulvimarina endophytica TaxID=2293836 RepID=A0A371XA85_9HYPH|nr:hypothetical protein DYI37_01365 [Fulvimarina endophytica]